MAIFGSEIEWRFVISMYPCSVKDCENEAILVERLSGRRLCEDHADENILSNARKNAEPKETEPDNVIYRIT